MEDLASLLLRLVVGTIFLAQGSRKIFGAPEAHHGRSNLTRMIAARGFSRPAPLAWAVSAVELGCGSLLLIGLLTRLAVIPVIGLLLAAIFLFKLRDGFIGGWDWPLSVLGSSIVILMLGAGQYSLDAVLMSNI